MAGPQTLVGNLAVSLSSISKLGPRTIKAIVDESITANDPYSIDMTQNVNAGQIDGIQSVYVDNRSNNAQLLITANDTGFTIAVPPATQGTYPILTGAAQFTVTSGGAGNGQAILFFCNFSLVYFQWTGSGSGTVIVSDPVLDSTVSGGKINVRDSVLDAIVSGGRALTTPNIPSGVPTSRSTATVGAASTQLMAANAARQYILIQAPPADTLWLNLLGGTASAGGADCFALAPGQKYESGNYCDTAKITYFCATGAVQISALEG